MEENEVRDLIKAIKGISLFNEDDSTNLKFISDSSQEVSTQLKRLNDNIEVLIEVVKAPLYPDGKNRCCDLCNRTTVIPERVKRMKETVRW